MAGLKHLTSQFEDGWKPNMEEFQRVADAAAESQEKLLEVFVDMSKTFAGMYAQIEERVAMTVAAFADATRDATVTLLAPHECVWLEDGGWECTRCGNASSDLAMMTEMSCSDSEDT